MQVRLDCYALLKGRIEPRGTVRVTKAYNLPSKYIFHTVGPVIFKEATKQDEKDLENCYLSCLEKAREMGLHTLAFCCLSTGVYAFPKKEACRIAVRTVRTWKKKDESFGTVRRPSQRHGTPYTKDGGFPAVFRCRKCVRVWD